MKHASLWREFTIVALGLLIVGCANVIPVKDLEGQPITTASGKPPSLDQAQKAIVRAGGSFNGMRMAVVRPGVVDATYAPRSDFTCVMEITFDSRSYNIRYKSSEGLSYDPAAHTIHKSYNSWVSNLAKRIDNEFMAE